MPDLITIFSRWWKFILGITLLAVLIAFIISILSPEEYLSEATALPANSMVADKARIFNNNIEALYSDIGTPDELDRLEGTGILDTLYIAAADSFSLGQHYGYGEGGESNFNAARKLKKNSKIARSAFGELKVKVWDQDRNLAAALANFLMNRLQEIHQQLQAENSKAILERMEQDYAVRMDAYRRLSDSAGGLQRADAEIMGARKAALLDQIGQYETMMSQYRLAINTNPSVLLVVEPARPSLWPDKPKTLQVTIFTLAAALAVSLLLALFFESRKSRN